MTDVPKQVSDYMSAIGAKGGAKGRGKKKRRGGSEHYRKMSAARKKQKEKTK
jgi:hypothetical protein